MRRSFLIIAIALFINLLINNMAAAQVNRDTNKLVSSHIINGTTENIRTLLLSKSNYSVFTQAITKVKLDTVLAGAGPFTVFAPVNAAFSKLPKNKSDSLMRSAAKLKAVLKGHIVAGKYTKSDLIKLLIAGKGTATLNTICGELLTLTVNANKNLAITDARGVTVQVDSFDMTAGNGVVHSLNGVLTK